MPSKQEDNVWTKLPISKGYLSVHLVFLFVTSTLQLTYGQCIEGTVSFEKIAGTTLREAVQAPLYSIAPSAREADNPVTAECTNRCRASPDCPAFLINYDRRACFALNIISEGRRESLTPSPDKTNYFEKICLKAPGCERAWTFERVVGKELLGFDDRIIGNIRNRLECQELCLQERVFPCRSGEYDYTLQQCRLSAEDRRSQPSSFRPAIGNVDYFENQCVDNTGGPGQCQYEQKNDLDLQQPDLLRSAFSPEQCRALCDGTRAFVCRSFTFQPSAARCWLSSDDVVSAGARALVPRSEVFFYQRSNCLDMKLTCSSEAMKLTLKTLEPFDGRIFAKSAPHKCEIYGNSRTSTVFELPLVSENCGGRKERNGEFSNTVVIQHHPVIQRKGDRMIQLLCLFEASQQTVTNSFNLLIGGGGAATSVVNATAPSPNIRLRITDRNGQDITGARLGDELYLRIEIDDDSVFGILARDLVARNGRDDDYIILIDNNGCPTDPSIFPSLEKVPGTKALQGKFDAFKFSDDVVVRFQVNVQFCLQECDPVSCGDSNSYGRRRRRKAEESPFPILPDYPLQREIIVEGISVTRTKDDDITKNTGNNGENVICTSKTVVAAAVISAVLIQLCIITACITCLVLNRRSHDRDDVSTTTSHMTPFGSRGILQSLRRLE